MTTETNQTSRFNQVRNVTPQNFERLAKEFMARNQMGWSIINPVNDPQLWGAWFAYRRAKKLGTEFMRQRCREMLEMRPAQLDQTGWTVPCDFPSDFDADRDWLDDKAAGDFFMDKLHERRQRLKAENEAMNALSPEQRADRTKRIMRGIDEYRDRD